MERSPACSTIVCVWRRMLRAVVDDENERRTETGVGRREGRSKTGSEQERSWLLLGSRDVWAPAFRYCIGSMRAKVVPSCGVDSI